MSPLSEVLFRLTYKNNMHGDMSPETCPHKTELPFVRVPFMRWRLYLPLGLPTLSSSYLAAPSPAPYPYVPSFQSLYKYVICLTVYQPDNHS